MGEMGEEEGGVAGRGSDIRDSWTEVE